MPSSATADKLKSRNTFAGPLMLLGYVCLSGKKIGKMKKKRKREEAVLKRLKT